MISTIELVPENFRNDPQVIAACYALDEELKEIYADIPSVMFWADLDNQTSPLLDVLMWEYHVDIYQHLIDGAPLTDDDKRNLIDKSIVWHQKKGTKWMVEQVLQSAFPTAQVVEWFEYGGNPFFFRIVVDEDVVTDPELFKRITDAVMAVKNVRSWLEPDGGFIRPIFSRNITYVGGTTFRRKKQVIPSYTEDRMP